MVKVDYGFVDQILENYEYNRTKSIAILQDIQAKYRFLPKEALMYVAEKLGMSNADLFGVATFYENFSLNEKGKYVIKCCDGTACHVRKSEEIQEALYDATDMTPGQHVSDDGLFTIERVACLGACSLAPACTVNDVVYASMTPKKVYKLVADLKGAK